jgi:hypothetical protein
MAMIPEWMPRALYHGVACKALDRAAMRVRALVQQSC